MSGLGMLLTENAAQAAAKPIVELINQFTGPLIAIVVALGSIYAVFLGVKLAKAEEPQDKMKAKGQLKNAIIGFILIFVLIVVLRVTIEPLTNWMNKSAGTTITTQVTQGSN